MKGGVIRPMSGAMVEGSRGDCDQAALYLTAHADLPCNRINCVPDPARGLREKALGYCSAMAFGGRSRI